MKDKKILIAVIAFAIVLLITVGATYAYFTATATTDTTAETLNVKTAELGITYAHGTGVNLENLTLTADYSSYVPFSVTNNGTLDQTFQVMWDTITTNTIVGYANIETNEVCNDLIDTDCTDVRDDFEWTLYELPTAFNTGNPGTSIAAGQMMGEGYLFGATSDSIIVPNLLIATGATKNYVLRIDFNYYSVNERTSRKVVNGVDNYQDYQQGKQFTGTMKVDNVEMYTPLATTGTTTDWQVSTTTNASGGYTLEAFTGDLDNSQNVRVVEDYFNDSNTSKTYMGASPLPSPVSTNAYIIQIPSEVGDKTITEIAGTLFNAVSDGPTFIEKYFRIKEVVIPEGIIKIQGGIVDNFEVAFCGNLNLDKITLPNTLVEIGDAAFYSTGLYELKIPSSLEIIGDYVFISSDYLHLVFPNNSSLTTIGTDVFSGKGLTGTLTLPATLETIGENAFRNNNITSVVFAGNNVIELDDRAFGDNDLTGVFTIPQSVTKFGTAIFEENPEITSLNFLGKSSLNGVNYSTQWNREDSHPNAIIPHTFTP